VSFTYDPFGRRIEKISPTTTSIFAYDGDNLVETVNGLALGIPGHFSAYTQGQNIDEALAMERGSTTDYYEADGLGSITSLTASNGTHAGRPLYAPRRLRRRRPVYLNKAPSLDRGGDHGHRGDVCVLLASPIFVPECVRAANDVKRAIHVHK
jgi:hypothetical protein